MSYCINPACFRPENPSETNFCHNCGTSLLLDNRYRAIRLLGAGGMGRNLLATDERTPTKKRCVIKQLFPDNAILNNQTAYQKAIKLFQREAATLDELGDKSPHIPRLMAYLEQDKRLYFVQEFINGQNLRDELQQQGSYNEAQIYQLLNNLLPVLKFIHQEKVIHRDIKPDNIMRRQDNQLVLIDFGLSKQLRGTLLLDAGTRGGTLGYAPPEQMTYGEAFAASDIYAVGATCINLMTNISPDELYNFNERRWIWSDVLVSRGVTVSNKLKQVLDKMLMADYMERYQSVEQVINDLFSQMTTTAIGSHSPTPNKLELVVAKIGVADYRTIGEAIANSQPGTSILVRRGFYQESIVIDKPIEIIVDGEIGDIVIESTDSNCILMQTDYALVRGLSLHQRLGQQDRKFFAVDIPQGQLILENCDIKSDSLSCIGIHGDKAKPIIRGCKIHDSKDAGVFVYEKGQGIVENCDIFANARCGVVIKQSGDPIIRNCQIHDDKESGVYVWEKGQGTIENCDIFANANSGVAIKLSGNPTIRNCKIHHGKSNGVYVWEKGQGTVENCDIFANANSGVGIREDGNPTIRNCKIHHGKSSGVFVYKKGQGTVENCDIFTNTNSGVEIKQGGNPIITTCRINNHKDYAIYVHDQGAGKIQNCDLTLNQNGACYFAEGCSVSRSGNKEY